MLKKSGESLEKSAIQNKGDNFNEHYKNFKSQSDTGLIFMWPYCRRKKS